MKKLPAHGILGLALEVQAVEFGCEVRIDRSNALAQTCVERDGVAVGLLVGLADGCSRSFVEIHRLFFRRALRFVT